MNRTYKNRQLQVIYDAMRRHARDACSDLYHTDGAPRRGASHRCSFWSGYYRNALVPPRNSLGFAAYMAGRDFSEECPGIEDTRQNIIGRV